MRPRKRRIWANVFTKMNEIKSPQQSKEKLGKGVAQGRGELKKRIAGGTERKKSSHDTKKNRQVFLTGRLIIYDGGITFNCEKKKAAQEKRQSQRT